MTIVMCLSSHFESWYSQMVVCCLDCFSYWFGNFEELAICWWNIYAGQRCSKGEILKDHVNWLLIGFCTSGLPSLGWTNFAWIYKHGNTVFRAAATHRNQPVSSRSLSILRCRRHIFESWFLGFYLYFPLNCFSIASGPR